LFTRMRWLLTVGWDRRNFSDYKEIYLRVSMETLQRRETKGLYARAMKGELKDVVGIDIEFTPPPSPDLVIDNEEDDLPMGEVARVALQTLGCKIPYPYTVNNLLGKRESYQYSSFEGPIFLQSFEKTRQITRTLFEKSIESQPAALNKQGSPSYPWFEILDLKEGSCLFLNQELPPPRGKINLNGTVSTRDFLIHALNELSLEKKIDENLILKLLQRFEVTKKLYNAYIYPDLKRDGNDYKDPLNYALFSLLLSRLFSSG